MMLLPAVDIMEGRCVRLAMGREEARTDYNADPEEQVRYYENEGADMVHVVDLDAAFGKGRNTALIGNMVKATRLPIETGGGVRAFDDIDHLLSLGVKRVILGTVAVKQPDLVGEAVARFGSEAIAVGIDARHGKASIKGWVEQTEVSAVALALQLKQRGVNWIIYTDIGRDGMMAGANVAETALLARETGMKVVASGGVHSLDDLRALIKEEATGITGIITGKAIYEGRFMVREAADLCH